MLEILIVHGGSNSIRAGAAAILVARDFGRFHRIIFTGGNLSGGFSLVDTSEAGQMKNIFFEHLINNGFIFDRDELEKRIILERHSYDTEDNAQKVVAIIGITGNFHFTLLSSLSHLLRIKSTYFRLGFRNISTISAERLFYESRIKSYIRYIISYDILRTALFEIPLYMLTQSVLGRRWIRSKTIERIRDK